MKNNKRWFGLLQNDKLVAVSDFDKKPTIYSFDVAITQSDKHFKVVELEIKEKEQRVGKCATCANDPDNDNACPKLFSCIVNVPVSKMFKHYVRKI